MAADSVAHAPATPALHAGAWLAWLAAIVTVMAVTRNPLYLGIVVCWIAVTTLLAHRLEQARPQAGSGLAPRRFSPWVFGALVITLSALFNALNVRVGETVLFQLPRAWPLIGGPITLEAVAYGALNGLALSGLFAAFVLLNRVTPVRSLVRLAPRAYYPVAVVVTIAVTYAPSTVRQFEEIRQAQAIRGHRIRGVRSWVPLIMPLLIGGLERALQLAEAMMARGFAAEDNAAASGAGRTALYAALVGGMGMLLTGMLLHLVWRAPVWGPAALAAGAGLVGWSVWHMGRSRRITTYRPEPWQGRDTLVCLGAAVTVLAFLAPLPGIDRSTIHYYPYPALVPPQLDVVVGLGTWGLLLPALWLLNDLLGHSARR